MDIRHSLFTKQWPEEWEDITEIWIIGGDGTLNYFINLYPHIDLPLAIFAGGSGNDFHWMLYGKRSVEDQVEVLLEGTPKPVDAGMVNEKLFLNGVGIGFDGAIVKDLLGKRKREGKTSYFISLLKHVLFFREKHFTIIAGYESHAQGGFVTSMVTGYQTISEDCFMISIANGQRYGGGFRVSPKANVSDGLLDLNIILKISPLRRLRYLQVVEKGEHLEKSFNQHRQGLTFQITTSRPVHAHMDGEYFLEKEFRIEVLPKRFSFIY
jgi:diacylglycerol kinase (ATP)